MSNHFKKQSFLAFVYQLCNHSAFEAEGEVAAVAEQRHFKEMEAVDVRDGVDPFGEALHVPQLPEKSADERGKAEAVDVPPVAVANLWEKRGAVGQTVERHQQHSYARYEQQGAYIDAPAHVPRGWTEQ